MLVFNLRKENFGLQKNLTSSKDSPDILQLPASIVCDEVPATDDIVLCSNFVKSVILSQTTHNLILSNTNIYMYLGRRRTSCIQRGDIWKHSRS